ncbi:MAG: response regulator [Candidatus Paceibacterota bacterium]
MKNVLLVEDEAFLANLLKSRLEKEGLVTQVARDGEEALKLLKEAKFDLVLLDIILPKLSGFEVLESMQADPQLQGVPVMIISNLGQESDISRGQSLGTVEYFVKAKVSIDDLVVHVKKYLKE